MFQWLTVLFAQFTCFLLHVDQTAAFPAPLSKAEEQACLEALAVGDTHARETLIAHNLRLVAHMTKKFYSPDIERDELISIGTLGLIKAVETFQPEKGARFATYAGKCIENEILMHYRSRKKSVHAMSFDEPIEYDKDGNAMTLMDLVREPAGLEESVEGSLQTAQLYEFLKTCLDPREWEVIVHRYGLFGYPELTQREVAAKLGISRSYVSRLEKHALEVLRRAYETG